MTAHNRKISMTLLRESIWGIEDRLKVVIETLADHEAEIRELTMRLDHISTRRTKIKGGKTRNDNGKR